VRSARPEGAAPVGAQMQVRIVTAPAIHAATDPTDEALASATQATLPAAAATDGVAAAAPPNSLATDTQPAGAPASASPPVPKFGLVLPGIDSDGDYYPRALLSKAPSPLDAVAIDYPLIENDSGYHVSELTLFIDETGRVARVRVDGASLPAAFAGSKFRAGEVDGRAVKSQIRIEVVFDNRPVDRP
jgi:periplasmic protein TonB